MVFVIFYLIIYKLNNYCNSLLFNFHWIIIIISSNKIEESKLVRPTKIPPMFLLDKKYYRIRIYLKLIIFWTFLIEVITHNLPVVYILIGKNNFLLNLHRTSLPLVNSH